ncbi:MAG: TrkH family potassium uptake protein [Pseudomonadota bacterium]|jgi:trk system potassium uptake protein TrkH|uniref:TrkH family potassium uptake protein n=1 Tax=Thalassococcus sp. TaxID=1928858 RepID=UPI001B080812|nr:TrkH family potassium uptake protein [Thalassococcus sp.]MBO6867080.1 TrkH family potassium uptake protein [Thalassococcus sp.]MEC8581129.1 TrkH family potassium uptake protein [Pseudomonadota bacterium]
MFDLRPVAYVIGLLVSFLGVTMLFPLIVDIAEGRGAWPVFLESAIISILAGGLIALSSANGVKERLSLQQTFLLTTGVWVALPIFGAIPFVIGATEATIVDAYFEAMSGLTTTGSTVFSGLDDLPKGLLLWRGLLQWLGGIGIIVVAMVFLPELRVGGMQIFRSEAFDTMGKILPRATEISASISTIYVTITLICGLCYLVTGMNAFDATVHALTTVSTGGFSNYDASFGTFQGPAEYVASVFMILAALPFVRFVQMARGNRTAILYDSQVRAFLAIIVILVVVTVSILVTVFPHHPEQAIREALFNITSIMTGTGYASVDYMQWGPFLIAMFFFIGLIGGCAGSTACSVKVFRYQLLVASIKTQLRKIRSPNGIFTPRYEGRPVSEDVMSSVMSFFMFFLVILGMFAIALGMTGLDFITSISGAATALANIGPGLGDEIGPAGNFQNINDTAKWLLIFAMLMGRLELMAVLILFTVRFWRG